METPEIITVTAILGQKPGEAVASYQRSIVFLPREAVVGSSLRIMLQETGKLDRNSRPIYRGLPAPPKMGEIWKDNGDGKATRTTTSTDWLGNTSEVGGVETRLLASREGTPSVKTEEVIVWGATLADTVLLASPTTVVPVEEERVQNGTLVWVKTGERTEPQPAVIYPVEKAKTDNSSQVCQWGLTAAFTPTWIVVVSFTLGGGYIHNWLGFKSFSFTWADMPKWWQDDFLASRPLCSCGRERIDLSQPAADGYSKCRQCRKEETCVRCSQQAGTATLIGGRPVCDSCKPYETAEQQILAVLTPECRQRLADLAERLLAGQLLPREAGEIVLGSLLGHIQDQFSRDQILCEWSGYPFYIFAEDGVYATKLQAVALTLLSYLPQAAGNGLVEMVSWMTGGQKYSDDFYTRTQVRGERLSGVPDLSRLFAELSAGQLDCLAVRLCGSTADRQAALAKHAALKGLASEALLAPATAALFGNSQDYAEALAKLAEVEQVLAAVNRGECLLDFGGHTRLMGVTGNNNYWVISPDGNQREPDASSTNRYGTVERRFWNRVEPEELALSWGCRTLRDVAGSGTFKVDHLPVSGVTPRQEAAVDLIEEEIGAPRGSFCICPNWEAENAPKLAAIQQAAEGFFAYPLQPFRFEEVAGPLGIPVNDQFKVATGNCGEFDWHGQSAQSLVRRRVAGGILEIFRYWSQGVYCHRMWWYEEETPAPKPTRNSPETAATPLEGDVLEQARQALKRAIDERRSSV